MLVGLPSLSSLSWAMGEPRSVQGEKPLLGVPDSEQRAGLGLCSLIPLISAVPLHGWLRIPANMPFKYSVQRYCSSFLQVLLNMLKAFFWSLSELLLSSEHFARVRITSISCNHKQTQQLSGSGLPAGVSVSSPREPGFASPLGEHSAQLTRPSSSARCSRSQPASCP